jgi:sugar/nucleoside kinase (ribokinase family)
LDDIVYDVVVVGNIGIDTNVYLKSAEIDFSVEANFTENLDYVGQAGGYVSRGFAQLGFRTSFIGSIGEDYHANWIKSELRRDGIDLTAVFIDPAGTSRSVNFMYPDGRRKNFYDGKGHMELRPDLDTCRSVLSKTKLVHFSIPNWARFLLPMARDLDLVISCDLQDIVRVDDPYRLDFAHYSDILFFSAVNYPDPAPVINYYLNANPEQVIVVGMGELGSAVGTDGRIDYYPPVKLEEPVIDTNGAGDGLVVGFLSGYVLEGFPLEESILRGQITARHTCGVKASTSELITRSQLEAMFQKLTSV